MACVDNNLISESHHVIGQVTDMRRTCTCIISSPFLSDYIIRFGTMALKAMVATCFLSILPSRKKVYMLQWYTPPSSNIDVYRPTKALEGFLDLLSRMRDGAHCVGCCIMPPLVSHDIQNHKWGVDSPYARTCASLIPIILQFVLQWNGVEGHCYGHMFVHCCWYALLLG